MLSCIWLKKWDKLNSFHSGYFLWINLANGANLAFDFYCYFLFFHSIDFSSLKWVLPVGSIAIDSQRLWNNRINKWNIRIMQPKIHFDMKGFQSFSKQNKKKYLLFAFFFFNFNRNKFNRLKEEEKLGEKRFKHIWKKTKIVVSSSSTLKTIFYCYQFKLNR